ncbi:hypothetical protein AVEN_47786-1, partial [Araneus ventricosus]
TGGRTPSDEIVELEGRVLLEDVGGDPAVKQHSFHEHPVDAGERRVHLDRHHRLAKPALQGEGKQQQE